MRRPSTSRHSLSGRRASLSQGLSRSPSKLFEGAPENHCSEKLRSCCAKLCENGKFSALTTVLTIYALFGDDMRLATMHQDVDNVFNIFTILCIAVFALEVFVSAFGKPDYFFGFFFWLDVISTVTLVLDLSFVGDALFCTSSGAGGEDAARTSRAGRAGARASRTVRILRLFRLVKLYKSYKAAMDQRRKRREAEKNKNGADGSLDPGDNEEEDDSDDELLGKEEDGEAGDESVSVMLDSDQPGDKAVRKSKSSQEGDEAETRVGKKLSEMTTRRVIILVLIMLFSLPQFSASSHGMDEFRKSSMYGMDVLYERWRTWCPRNATGDMWCLQSLPEVGTTPTVQSAEARRRYEEYLLLFLYTHHVGVEMGRPIYWKLYWMGVKSNSRAPGYLTQLAQLGQTRFLGSYAVPASDWDALYSSSSWGVAVTPLANIVKARLLQPWTEQCKGSTGVRVSSQNVNTDDPAQCSVEKELRCTEVDWASPSMKSVAEGESFDFKFGFDKREATKFEAILSMLQTVFICVAVGLGSMFFTNDANTLLLNPIQRMIAKMETIKDNPLESIKLGDLEFRREQVEAARLKEELAKYGWLYRKMMLYQQKKKKKEPMETVILEKTIIKLGGLLALGFGEAGADVVAQNMRCGHAVELNPALPGHELDAIFASCGIRHCAVATEILAERVTLFVNYIAEIIHGCVDDFYGAPNQFSGGGFLIIWRYSTVAPEKRIKLADLAAMSFIRILVGVEKSPAIEELNSHPGLQARIPDFKVNLGIAMHAGWAIEGAIGSDFKIDAAYLSPHVKVAVAIEQATPHYGVNLILTHAMIKLLSKEMALLCRLIDHVKVKGSRQTLRLSCLDLDTSKLSVTHSLGQKQLKNRFKVRQVREIRKIEKWNDESNVSDAFKTDDDLIKMRSTYTTEFFQRFATAYRNYEVGQWKVARDMLYTCNYVPRKRSCNPALMTPTNWPRDGPTCLLLHYMGDKGFEAPARWPGYRDLVEKRKPCIPNALEVS